MLYFPKLVPKFGGRNMVPKCRKREDREERHPGDGHTYPKEEFCTPILFRGSLVTQSGYVVQMVQESL